MNARIELPLAANETEMLPLLGIAGCCPRTSRLEPRSSLLATIVDAAERAVLLGVRFAERSRSSFGSAGTRPVNPCLLK